jgi:hypothetical protein
VDWNHGAQNRVQWPALVNTVINLGSHKMRELLNDCQILQKTSVPWSLLHKLHSITVLSKFIFPLFCFMANRDNINPLKPKLI